MITAQNLTIESIFKKKSVYLVSHGRERAILKAEGLLLGTSSTDERENWVQGNGGTPQVKKTIEMMGKLISYVTRGDTELDMVRTFNKFETGIITSKVAVKEKIEVGALAGNVWYLMPVFDDFKTLPEVSALELTTLQRNPKCMRSLGHVLVCDAFMANTDRFGTLFKLKEMPGCEEPGIANPGMKET